MPATHTFPCTLYSRFQERSQLKGKCQKSTKQLLAVMEAGTMFSRCTGLGYLVTSGLRHSQRVLQNWQFFKTNELPCYPPAGLWNTFSQRILCTICFSTNQHEQLCATDLLLRKPFSSPISLLSYQVSQTRAKPDLQWLPCFPFSQPLGMLGLCLKLLIYNLHLCIYISTNLANASASLAKVTIKFFLPIVSQTFLSLSGLLQ